MTSEELEEIKGLVAGLPLMARAQQESGRHREAGVTFATHGALVALLREVDRKKAEEAVPAEEGADQ